MSDESRMYGWLHDEIGLDDAQASAVADEFASWDGAIAALRAELEQQRLGDLSRQEEIDDLKRELAERREHYQALHEELSASKAENERLKALAAGLDLRANAAEADRDALAERVKGREALLARLVVNDRHFCPAWDVDGLAADALREYENLVADTRAAIGEEK